MTHIYLDTNIILSLIRHAEEIFPDVEKMLELSHLNYFTGTIALVEMASVLSREYDTIKKGISKLSSDLDLPELIKLTPKEQIELIITYLLSKFQVSILEDLNPDIYVYKKLNSKINPIYKLALKQTWKTKLRSLDNIHFATARFYDEYLEFKIKYLVTADAGFLKKKKLCHKISDITVIDPKTFVEIES